jgi:hypothetical protein
MNVDATDDSKRDLIERLPKRPVTGATHAVWGFRNQTDFVTLAGGIARWCRERTVYDPQHTVAPRTRRFSSGLEPLLPNPPYTTTMVPRKAIPTPKMPLRDV